jgi:L-2-hydroxyglutarate oxidase LhgO
MFLLFHYPTYAVLVIYLYLCYSDFIIEHEAAKGFPGVVNLVGIESPGLTSSLAIARYVCDLLGFKTNEEHDVDG